MLLTCSLFAQETDSSTANNLRQHAINIFLDEVPDFIKKEIPFVNYVRDKNDAELVIIQTWQETGSGGDEITLFVEGQKRYDGIRDTIRINFYPGETEEQNRERSIRLIKIGLMKYVMDTPLVNYIDIQFTEPIEEEVSTDKWNNWVIQTRIRGFMSGQSTSNTMDVGTSLDVGRVTSEWRLNFGTFYNHSKTTYDYEGVNISNINRSNRIWSDAVKSLGDHWSVGLSADAFSSIYSNYDLQLSVQPAIEYDIFPYSESTRRIFRIYYYLRYAYHDYTDTTQFFKTEENLFSHSINTAFTTIQNWGNINLYAGWSNYLHDFSLNRLTLDTRIDLKLARGLNLNVGAGYSFIHDQVSLRKGSASVEDVLLQRHELTTSFSYFTHFGFTYTFGSIYNNVVNPRLESLF